MFVHINDRQYEARTGERLIDIARNNHSHIGYFCGGNGICQTCYVKVFEGMELLSPISDKEKAILSDELIQEGVRVACMTTLDKLGTVKLLTTVEEVKRTFETKPLDLIPYQGKMGWASLVKFPETIAMQAQRFSDGSLSTLQPINDIAGAIGGALELIFMAVQETFAGESKSQTFTRQYIPEPRKSDKEKTDATEDEKLSYSAFHESMKLQKHVPVN